MYRCWPVEDRQDTENGKKGSLQRGENLPEAVIGNRRAKSLRFVDSSQADSRTSLLKKSVVWSNRVREIHIVSQRLEIALNGHGKIQLREGGEKRGPAARKTNESRACV